MSGNSPQDKLPRFSFAGIAFPVESCRVRGSIRDHVHEYSHQDGGDNEMLGSRLYEFDLVGNFQAKSPLYPGLWPEGMQTLIALFEKSTVGPLVIPSRRTFQAYALDWTQEWSAKMRSGEKVPIRFRQDRSDLAQPINTSKPQAQSIQQATSNFNAAAAKAAFLYTPQDTNLFNQLTSLVGALEGIVDTAGMYASQVAARVAQIIALCQQIDQTASLQVPQSASVMQALHDVWAQAQQLAKDLQSKNYVMKGFTTPADMSIQRVSIQLFGNTTHVEDLLALNDLSNPLQIPAGTTVLYYPLTASSN